MSRFSSILVSWASRGCVVSSRVARYSVLLRKRGLQSSVEREVDTEVFVVKPQDINMSLTALAQYFVK
jgi:hypothetical protein